MKKEIQAQHAKVGMFLKVVRIRALTGEPHGISWAKITKVETGEGHMVYLWTGERRRARNLAETICVSITE